MNRRQRKKHPLRFLGYMPDASTTPWARMWRARAWGHLHIRRERAAERRREWLDNIMKEAGDLMTEWLRNGFSYVNGRFVPHDVKDAAARPA